MIFKNAELYNIGGLIPAEGGGYHMIRMSEDARKSMVGTNSQSVSLCPAGAEIRFVINSGSAKITIRSNGIRKMVVCYGAIHRGSDPAKDYYGTENTVIEIAPCPEPEKLAKLHEICGYNYSSNLIRLLPEGFGHDIIVDIEGDIRPPRPDEVPEKRFIMYGSSITHGCFSITQNNTYVYQIARKLGYDAYNFGFGGACLLEKELCDYIAEQGTEINDRTWDFAILELGINTVGGMEEAEFIKRANHLFDIMAEKNPDKKLFVTDCYPHYGDLTDGGKTEARRKALQKVIEGRKNVIFTPGNQLLTNFSGLSVDGIHPNVDGVTEIANNWYNVIKKHI